MNFTSYLNELLIKKNKLKTIGFIEGGSKRMISAALELKKSNLIKPIMLFETKKIFEQSQLNNKLDYLIIEEEKELMQKMFEYYFDKRKNKETEEQIKKDLKTTPYFGAALVAIQKIDGVIGGVYFPSSKILRSAFKVIGAKTGIKTISSAMVMHKNIESYIFSDISVNIDPNENQLVDIAKNACNFATSLNIEKRVAFLSFSTLGSASAEKSIKIKNATEKFNSETNYQNKAIGEIQFDAAYNMNIRSIKYKNKKCYPKPANILIFPDLNAANIGYKIAQQMGEWGAIGPILTGVAKPMNDLSRGATISDIKYTAILTALQSF